MFACHCRCGAIARAVDENLTSPPPRCTYPCALDESDENLTSPSPRCTYRCAAATTPSALAATGLQTLGLSMTRAECAMGWTFTARTRTHSRLSERAPTLLRYCSSLLDPPIYGNFLLAPLPPADQTDQRWCTANLHLGLPAPSHPQTLLLKPTSERHTPKLSANPPPPPVLFFSFFPGPPQHQLVCPFGPPSPAAHDRHPLLPVLSPMVSLSLLELLHASPIVGCAGVSGRLSWVR